MPPRRFAYRVRPYPFSDFIFPNARDRMTCHLRRYLGHELFPIRQMADKAVVDSAFLGKPSKRRLNKSCAVARAWISDSRNESDADARFLPARLVAFKHKRVIP